MTCQPYDEQTHRGGFCFESLCCKVLGAKYPQRCLECFAAAGRTVDNSGRKP